jgi:Fic family protein
MYIWQHPQWPLFSFDSEQVKPKLKALLALQKRLVGKSVDLTDGLDKEAEQDALIQSAIKTSEIEGENLNVESVRSSVARQLGLEQAGMPKPARHEAGVVQMLVSAVSDIEKPLTKKMLCDWQAAIFHEPPLLRNIAIGRFRDDAIGPMQVVSEKRGKTTIHFEAPPAKKLAKEITAFLEFYNDVSLSQSGFIRAAMAHLYLITLHPFDDGNGRVARALTDRVLAQSEYTSVRFYSLSAAIEKNKNAYYQILEETQGCCAKGQDENPLDITQWVLWFLQTLEQAMSDGLLRIDRVLIKARFWRIHAQTVLSKRQIKVLNRLLDGYGLEFVDGLAARHYQSIADVSKATATRDLADMVEKNCLKPLELGGRSVRYVIQR